MDPLSIAPGQRPLYDPLARTWAALSASWYVPPLTSSWPTLTDLLASQLKPHCLPCPGRTPSLASGVSAHSYGTPDSSVALHPATLP